MLTLSIAAAALALLVGWNIWSTVRARRDGARKARVDDVAQAQKDEGNAREEISDATDDAIARANRRLSGD